MQSLKPYILCSIICILFLAFPSMGHAQAGASADQIRLSKIYGEVNDLLKQHIRTFAERKYELKYPNEPIIISRVDILTDAFAKLPTSMQGQIMRYAEKKFAAYQAGNDGKPVEEILEESLPKPSRKKKPN